MSFTDDRAKKNLKTGLYGLTRSLPELKDALLDIQAVQVRLIKNDIDNIRFSLPLCEDKEISNLFEEYFDSDVINFLANVNDLIQEVDKSIAGTNDYYDTLENIMYSNR